MFGGVVWWCVVVCVVGCVVGCVTSSAGESRSALMILVSSFMS